MKKKRVKDAKKTKYAIAMCVITAVILVLTGVGQYQISNYEASVISLYAMQQDDYVQLVLDQINLQKDRADEEIVSGILGTLDASSRKYWTLTKDQALLFVKNVTETNRYKGFTTGTYFSSDTAKVFLDKLNENHVVHEFIELDGEDYVASGVIFEYRGSQYKICLLTSETVIIDQNVFFETKISVYIYISLLLLLLTLSVMYLTRKLYQTHVKNAVLHEKVEAQNKIITDLGQQIRMVDAYHSRFNVFNVELLPKFMRKLRKKGMDNMIQLTLRFSSKAKRDAYLENAQLLLDEKVFRFGKEDETLVLLFVGYKENDAKFAARRVGDFGQEVSIDE